MLASIPEFREVEFSHLTISDISLEVVEPVRNPQSTLLWRALLLSLLLHLSLLIFQFGEKQLHPNQVLAPTLHIDLRQLPIKKQDVAPEISARAVVSSPVITKKMVTVEKSLEAKPVTRLVIEPLSAQELTEVVDSHNAQTDDPGSAAIAENVFHPGLRARLGEEASKPVLARVEGSGPQTYTDPSGAMVVILSNGKCLKSPLNTKIGAPQNWYMTSCGGKSESEKIMDRVNQSVNGKLKFEE